MASIRRITLIGAGNVAFHLARAIHGTGMEIVQVFSRTMDSARTLADKYNAGAVSDIGKISSGSDLYIIAVSDNALPEVANRLNLADRPVVHTSGSHSLEVLKNTSARTGVIYPLQTFSKMKDVNFSKVPLCIEASSAEVAESLKDFSLALSDHVNFLPSGKRKILHLSAVFACNMPNYLYSIAQELLEQNDIDFELLKPLIMETADKAIEMDPREAQTGPAWRRDDRILEKHLSLLDRFPEYREIYKLLSDNIIKMKENKDENL